MKDWSVEQVPECIAKLIESRKHEIVKLELTWIKQDFMSDGCRVLQKTVPVINCVFASPGSW